MSEEKKEVEQSGLFKPANEYTPDELMLAQDNFKSFFQWTLDVAKGNAPENNGISVKASIGRFSAEITYSPPIIRYSRGGRTERKTEPATRAQVEAVVMEYPAVLTMEETATSFIVSPKSFMGDAWRGVMDKFNPFGAQWKPPTEDAKKAWVIPKKAG